MTISLYMILLCWNWLRPVCWDFFRSSLQCTWNDPRFLWQKMLLFRIVAIRKDQSLAWRWQSEIRLSEAILPLFHNTPSQSWSQVFLLGKDGSNEQNRLLNANRIKILLEVLCCSVFDSGSFPKVSCPLVFASNLWKFWHRFDLFALIWFTRGWQRDKLRIDYPSILDLW